MAKTALAIGAHPDDIEFLFGGSLALLRKLNGDNVDLYMIAVCNGNMGSAVLKPDELRETRWGENKKSAAIIGAHYDNCDIGDLLADFYRHLAKDILVGQIRQIKPDIVMTHSPNDNYMPDHRVMAGIVADALFCAMLPNYNPKITVTVWEDIRTRGEKEGSISGYQYMSGQQILPLPALYYGDPFPGYDCLGNTQESSFVVDITSAMKKKVEMLLEHKSQGAWLATGHGDSDYMKTVKEWNKKTGMFINVEYAEAFLRHKGTPYNQEKRLEIPYLTNKF